MGEQKFLIIGGSSGIGLEIVHTLKDRGDAIYVGSRSRDKLNGLSGITHLPLDVAKHPLRLEMLPEMLDGLVYCPGTIRLNAFHRLTRDDFVEDLEINYLGAVQVIQACLPNLKRSPRGASILLFSTVAVQTGMPFHASVAGAKGAVEGLSRSLAAELAPRIRVNTIAPSLTDTPSARNVFSSEEKLQASAGRHPLKRIGTPKDIARLAVFLLTDAGGWITGQVFHIDGGMGSLRVFN
jgi:NAD(P)-dependent dehydrogenase (short-subunit alcohol dehydrogenase family)